MVIFLLLCCGQFCRSGRIYVRTYHFCISSCIKELIFIEFEYLKVFLACQGPTVVTDNHCYHLQGQPGTVDIGQCAAACVITMPCPHHGIEYTVQAAHTVCTQAIFSPPGISKACMVETQNTITTTISRLMKPSTTFLLSISNRHGIIILNLDLNSNND